MNLRFEPKPEDSDPTINRRYTLFMFLACAVLYPLWDQIFHIVYIRPESASHYILSLICLIGAGLSLTKLCSEKTLWRYYHFAGYALAVHQFWLLHNSNFALTYQMGSLLLFVCVITTLPSTRSMLHYLGFLLLASLPLIFLQENMQLASSWAAIIATLVTTFIPSTLRQKKLAQQLSHNRANLQVLLDDAAVGISRVDANGNFVDVNPRFAELLGYSKDEVLKLNVDDITPHAQLAERQKNFEMRMSNQILNPMEDRPYLKKDGTIAWLRLYLQRIHLQSHGAEGLVAVSFDITRTRELTMRQAELQNIMTLIAHGENPDRVFNQIDKLMRDAIPSVHSIVIRRENDGHSNPEAIFQSGLLRRQTIALEEAMNSLDDKDIVASDIPHNIGCEEALVSKNNAVIGHVLFYGNDELRFTSEERDLMRQAASLIALVLERRAADNQISKQQYQILSSEKMASLGLMAAGLAHEISNPMSVIYGKARQIGLILDDAVPDLRKIEEFCNTITRMSDRITRILRGVRSFSRNAADDAMQLAPAQSIVDDTLTLCAERLYNHGVRFEISPLPGNVYLECRETQISQILFNLLNNAYDAIKSEKDRWIRLDVESDGTSIRFAVTDCGKGIEKSMANRLFQPFFTTKALGKGTGLGLSISADIARAHGGQLRIDSNCEHTRFVLDIPLRQSQKAAA